MHAPTCCVTGLRRVGTFGSFRALIKADLYKIVKVDFGESPFHALR